MELPKSEVTLEERVILQLKQNGYTITTAESCTGGLLSGRLINVPGTSSVLKEAYVTYCDEAKHKLLGVKKETLEQYTAVSAKTAEEMASGAAKAANADICLSVTGVAGPDGGSEEFPVGLVYIGCYILGCTSVKRFLFQGDRSAVRAQAVEEALVLLLELLNEHCKSQITI